MLDHWPFKERRDDKDDAVALECRDMNSEAGLDSVRPDSTHVRENGCRGASNTIVYVEATASYGKMQVVILRGDDGAEYLWTEYGI